jgi:hypothetical protein
MSNGRLSDRLNDYQELMPDNLLADLSAIFQPPISRNYMYHICSICSFRHKRIGRYYNRSKRMSLHMSNWP